MAAWSRGGLPSRPQAALTWKSVEFSGKAALQEPHRKHFEIHEIKGET